MTDTDSAATSIAGTDSDPRTHMSDHLSTRRQRIEVIVCGERRRRWSPKQKQLIVAESLAANVSMAAIARKHGIGTGQLYGWRHQLLGSRAAEASGFARVGLTVESRGLAGPVCVASAGRSGLIEIVLPGGASVRVDAQVDEQALRRVLAVLRG